MADTLSGAPDGEVRQLLAAELGHTRRRVA